MIQPLLQCFSCTPTQTQQAQTAYTSAAASRTAWAARPDKPLVCSPCSLYSCFSEYFYFTDISRQLLQKVDIIESHPAGCDTWIYKRSILLVGVPNCFHNKYARAQIFTKLKSKCHAKFYTLHLYIPIIRFVCLFYFLMFIQCGWFVWPCSSSGHWLLPLFLLLLFSWSARD